MGSAGPWPALLLLVTLNLIYAMATGAGLPTMTVVSIVAMTASLVTFVGLIGSGGSDPLSTAATAFAVARALAIVVFIGSVVALIGTTSISLDSVILTGINFGLGGLAIFQAILAAKPGG